MTSGLWRTGIPCYYVNGWGREIKKKRSKKQQRWLSKTENFVRWAFPREDIFQWRTLLTGETVWYTWNARCILLVPHHMGKVQCQNKAVHCRSGLSCLTKAVEVSVLNLSFSRLTARTRMESKLELRVEGKTVWTSTEFLHSLGLFLQTVKTLLNPKTGNVFNSTEWLFHTTNQVMVRLNLNMEMR